ncbi:MAG TPA: phosphoribosyltransferase [Kiritimatiellae bacterium]|nr:phosphoribosyltransferase [Kiritimatiellia bacterium]
MVFEDRSQAAELLAERLAEYRGRRPLVMGIPRGGVVMARLIADRLEGDLDVVLVHKLGAPGQPEVAVGAVDEEGNVFISEFARGAVSPAYIEEERQRQLAELQRRRAQYSPRAGRADTADRITIVVDDGLATGATMKAALLSLRKGNPAELVAAVPVASPDAFTAVDRLADRVVCLSVPEFFMAVGQFYRDFRQVEDEEVVEALRGRQSGR